MNNECAEKDIRDCLLALGVKRGVESLSLRHIAIFTTFRK